MVNSINPRKTVLLVDDDELHLEITKMALQEEYEVFMLKSGREALDSLSKKQIIPDIILLDIIMPEMDGWIVFDKIQDIAALEFTPIMFYSSLEEESAKEKAYELGAFDYIDKPCERTLLLAKIKDTLKKAELRKSSMS
jgi:putative two-component system response regulator